MEQRRRYSEKNEICVQSLGKGRKKSSVGLICILAFLKNNRFIFFFA